MQEIEVYSKIRDEVSKISAIDRRYGTLFRNYQRNMTTVYPHRSSKSMLSDFRRTLFYQRLAYRQQNAPFDQNDSQEVQLPQSLIQRPGVIVTAHTYSYRNIVRALAKSGLRLCLLVAKRVYDKQQQEFENIMKSIYGEQFDQSFRLVEAEDPVALLKLRRAFNEGMYILGYIDGNSGSGGESQNANLQLVRFAAAHISARVGLFRIAQWLDCSIHSVWTKTKNDFRSTYDFRQVRCVGENEGLERIVQNVYNSLESAIALDPPQWECFLYLEEFICEPSKAQG